MVDLTIGMKQADVKPWRSTIVATRVAQFDILDVQTASIFCVKLMLSILLGDLRATNAIGEALDLDCSFVGMIDFSVKLYQVSLDVQQVATEN